LFDEWVAEGSLVCPLNADIDFEVMKQEDAQTLVETARLIDDLSLGVCMLPMMERMQLEVFHFIATTRQSKDGGHEPDELVWSKAAYVLGFVTPDCYKLPGPVNIAFQKCFADHMWTLGFEDQLNAMSIETAVATESPFKDISGQLNIGKFAKLQIAVLDQVV